MLLEHCLVHSRLLCIRVVWATGSVELHQTDLRKFTVYETGNGERLAPRLVDPCCICLLCCTQNLIPLES